MSPPRKKNDDNIYFGIGTVTPEETKKIRKIVLQETTRPYQILLYAKTRKGQYFTWDELIELNPQKYGGPAKKPTKQKQTIQRLLDHKLLETNPNNTNQYKITPLGVKYLFCKKTITARNAQNKNG